MFARQLTHQYLGRSVIAWCLLLCSVFCPPGHAAPADSVEFFVANYGLADESQPQIARAYQVFARVKATAALSGRSSPKLRIVKSEANPWAQALPDGNIVLSAGAVDVCYRLVSLHWLFHRFIFYSGKSALAG